MDGGRQGWARLPRRAVGRRQGERAGDDRRHSLRGRRLFLQVFPGTAAEARLRQQAAFEANRPNYPWMALKIL
jgi:hypothetical protein